MKNLLFRGPALRLFTLFSKKIRFCREMFLFAAAFALAGPGFAGAAENARADLPENAQAWAAAHNLGMTHNFSDSGGDKAPGSALPDEISEAGIYETAVFLRKGRIDNAAEALRAGKKEAEAPLLRPALKEMLALPEKGGAILESLPEEQRGRLFLLAANIGHIEALKDFIQQGVDPNFQDNAKGRTALHYAAREGHIEAAEILLEHGADPNIKDTVNEDTALHFAARKGLEGSDMIQLLADYGANPSALNKAQQTPFHLLFYALKPKQNKSILRSLILDGAGGNSP